MPTKQKRYVCTDCGAKRVLDYMYNHGHGWKCSVPCREQKQISQSIRETRGHLTECPFCAKTYYIPKDSSDFYSI